MKTIMKTKFAATGLAVAWLTLPGVQPQAQAGTWSTLLHPPPDYVDHLLLLSDGTVLATQGAETIGSNWFRLTPDSFGNYLNGTWTNIAPMHYTRQYFSSTVLRDGRVFVAGGEVGTGGPTAEIYNPLSNTWTVVSPPASVLDPTQISPGTGHAQTIADAECKVLPNGQVLICPTDAMIVNGTLLYDPVANSWTSGPPTLHLLAEASAVKLPDGSILTVDPDRSSSERYLPALNVWTNDASTSPAYLWASLYPYTGEQGPAFLLPDGRAIVFGGSGQTALYTPSGSNGPGVWMPGPNIPTNLVAADTAGAMMANGNILLAVSPPLYVTNNTVTFPSPLSFYEYNYSVGTTGAFTQVFGLNADVGSFVTTMLDLPSGGVLFGIIGSPDLYEYGPSGAPVAAGKPVISTITTNGDGSYHLTGTLFNGISEGAAFGDDHQMDSNFPLVRFTDVAGHVRYGRTYNWSSTGVMTGSAIVSTECMPPPGASITDLIQVVANGIASDYVVLLVTTTADSGFGSLRQVAGLIQGGGTVTFGANLSGQTITLTSGEIPITNNLTIDASALPNGIIIDGNHASRIFNIGSGAAVTLNALVLTNGYTTNDWGGAIFNVGTLALNYCTLAGNSGDSSVYGGAIANQGPLTVLGCTFSSSSASFSGAIDNRSTCTLENSTFYGNVAFTGNGGAIDNSFSATLSVSQCTFSGNSASSLGGAIDNYLSQVNITNTIASGNAGQDIYNWSGSTIDAEGANIVPALGNAGTLVGGGTISSVDPLLGAPGNNGGRTLTMMPQPGSPAIDAGVSILAAGLLWDQRGPGYPRIVGKAVDIGAVEYQAPVINSPSSVTFLAGLSNSFRLGATGAITPTIAVTGTFPLGVNFTPPGTLSGTPPYGSDGAYTLTVTASNGISPNATQYLTLNVVGPSVFAAHPNFNTNGFGWALNSGAVRGGPVINNDLLTLTDGLIAENGSAWFRYPLYVGAFEASFTYQDIGGGGADGVGFVIQNDPRGTTALGFGGGGLGYAGITSSVAVLLNIYSGSPGGSGLMLGTNGVDVYDGSGALSGNSYQSTAPVNLNGGNPIAVALLYTDGILQVSLTDTVTSANFQTDIPVDVPAFTGTNAAWVGITGSDGGVLSHQTVTNFSYVPLPVLLSNPGSGGSVNLSWPASIYGYHLQSTSDLLGNVWADLPATVTQTNGFNLAMVPATDDSQFFRLVLPPQ
jgi:hypothetical protein